MTGDELEHDLLDRACAQLSGGGGNARVIGEMAGAIQSRVWQLAVDDATGRHLYALKVFRPDYAYTSSMAVRDEYAALQALSAALAGLPAEAGLPAVRCPEPVAVWDEGYLMTWEPGVPLRAELADRSYDAFRRAAIAHALVPALRAFHRRRDAAFADFHAGNVLVGRDGALVLIDPNPANPGFYAGPISAHPPIVVDIAYWVFTEATRAVRRLVTEPRASLQRLSLARTLWQEAGIDRDPDAAAAFADCVRTFTGRLAGRGPRQRVIAAGSAVVLAIGWRRPRRSRAS